MGLFIVRHEHGADRCPAADPQAGASLLNYLGRSNARDRGVHIRAEAVVRGGHSLYMIVEAPAAERVREYMSPFAAVGSVDVYPATTCAGVVASGGCEAPDPPVDEAYPSVDPVEACERALEAGLVVHRAHPLNCETSVPALLGGAVVPNTHFYVRNHFQIPLLDPEAWRLHVAGHVDRSTSLGLRDLKHMPSESRVVTLECAGNGRARLDPPVQGEPWDLGAVSTAEWTGVPLMDALRQAGIAPTASHLVFRGADAGTVDGHGQPMRFERGMSLDEAEATEALLAYAMNGESLPIQHGYPLRLVVPGWYGVASVKWLTDIEVTDRPFDGHFQTGAYFYERDGEAGSGPTREPVTVQRVRALLTEPASDGALRCGEVTFRGVAWSGAAPVARVELSIGDGSWEPCRLVGEPSRHGWRWWELLTRVDTPGELTVRVRATDQAGNSQPSRPEWNRLGYGNNAVQQETLHFAS